MACTAMSEATERRGVWWDSVEGLLGPHCFLGMEMCGALSVSVDAESQMDTESQSALKWIVTLL